MVSSLIFIELCILNKAVLNGHSSCFDRWIISQTMQERSPKAHVLLKIWNILWSSSSTSKQIFCISGAATMLAQKDEFVTQCKLLLQKSLGWYIFCRMHCMLNIKHRIFTFGLFMPPLSSASLERLSSSHGDLVSILENHVETTHKYLSCHCIRFYNVLYFKRA